MVDYYPVTKEELDMIKNDCAHPETSTCDGWFAAWAVSKLFYPIYHHYIVAPRKAKQKLLS